MERDLVLPNYLQHKANKSLNLFTSLLLAGLASIVPGAVLPLLTWYELRGMVCGHMGVDLKLLEANTEYDDDGKVFFFKSFFITILVA